MIQASLFCLTNGYLQSSGWISQNSSIPFSRSSFQSLGLILFLTGFILNTYSDYYMLNQKKKNKTYVYPNSWPHQFVYSPNYLGEILEWTGYWLVHRNIYSFAFLVFTIANLLARAILTKDYYLLNFQSEANDNPNRKALIPFVW